MYYVGPAATKTCFREMFCIKLEMGKEYSLSECYPAPTYAEIFEEEQWGIENER